MNSFLAYMGGKSKLAPFIVSLFPDHEQYIEVFGGAGWVMFYKNRSKYEVYNDINSDLVNVFMQLRDNCEELQRRAMSVPYSREFFDLFSSTFQNHNLSDVERAVRFLYINKIAFSGQYQCGMSAGMTKPNWHTDYIKGLGKIRKRLDTVIIENLDFEKLIERYDSKDTLFYIDPPYFVADKTKYYKFVFTSYSHTRLFNTLCDIRGKFILSYEDAPEVRNLYKDFNIIETPKVKICSSPKEKKDEVVELCMTNFNVEKKQLKLF